MTVHTPLTMNGIGRETTLRAHGARRVQAGIRGFFLLVLASALLPCAAPNGADTGRPTAVGAGVKGEVIATGAKK